ncbi:hypothetical protein G7Z17_g12853 [Cylindrodendrum hubeiense]|uniref:Uncharacterized protein n=1 Tax=Cylindrodendrum hubeiense TaxID=595255 RepID=A0A9P5L2R4_9HYPO|nr:hypothetical protein G7Z17_g12853 [Cylindrodendrum hubeiense]
MPLPTPGVPWCKPATPKPSAKPKRLFSNRVNLREDRERAGENKGKTSGYVHVHLGSQCGLCNRFFNHYTDKIVIIRQPMFPLKHSDLMKNWVLYPGAEQLIRPSYPMPNHSPANDDEPEHQPIIHPDDTPQYWPAPAQPSCESMVLFEATAKNRPLPAVAPQLAPCGFTELPGEKVLLCSKKGCPERRVWPESAVVHRDCLANLSWMESDPNMVEHLWWAIICKAPWRDAPVQFFTRETPKKPLLTEEERKLAERGIPIPRVRQIMEALEGAPWSVDKELELYLALCICQVERLDEYPDPLEEKRVDDRAFILTEAAEHPTGVAMIFKNGLARLDIAENYPTFQTWDNPTPPRVHTEAPIFGSIPTQNVPKMTFDDCALCGMERTRSTRFFSIDLEGTRGISFLYHRALGLVDILSHTEETPYPKPPLDFPPESLDWIYMPLAEDDQCIGIATQMEEIETSITFARFQFRFEKTGRINIGKRCDSRYTYMYTDHATDLVYNRRERGIINLIGGGWTDNYCREQIHTAAEPAFLRETENYRISQGVYAPSRIPFFYTYAPLKTIQSVNIFRYSNGSVRSMIVNYDNGAKRVLGEHRAQETDDYETFRRPARICYNAEYGGGHDKVPTRGMDVSFGDLSYHEHTPAEKWKCHTRMTGVLEIWFNPSLQAHRMRIRRRRDDERFPTDYDYYNKPLSMSSTWPQLLG